MWFEAKISSAAIVLSILTVSKDKWNLVLQIVIALISWKRCYSHVVLFKILSLEGPVKELYVAKRLLAIWETFLYENNRNINSYKFSYKFIFIPFSFFLMNQNKSLIFRKWVVR